ncbi:protein naked cuticle homolog 2 isoform X3 [Homo sapiens]|uniref:protein naked cuticle homolog 2 isoform X3 n=1 Tax=Homo sapiens TaxID=9606 RepID=UPI000387AF5C|nr:protein naked cuticle homolog 2 isoform X3 [Homo sapiens]XP_054184642.1 protein naked cuticle homolog 2 isoform X3 [Homo sapiens]XP_054209705.1 protein naked cuticle homolog 2 isoform X3 [Homo sapiens]|eukprot:XP_005248440.1 protein naked cuticle homolog 2 isoform X3 [Homo sapiens]
MGKLQSKHAAAARKRRESPEGDSFVASAYASGRKGAEEAERRARDKQELPNGDPKEGPFREDQCPLQVALPAEKAEGREHPGQLLSADDGERAANREGPRGPGGQRLNIDALQCDVSVEEDDRQEWTFTLYDFDNCGKVTREDMSSLMHTIYEVVDASVNHSSGSSKTLRVKLTVSPEPSSKRKEGPPAGQDREPTRCRMEGELAEEPRVADRRLSAHVRRPLSFLLCEEVGAGQDAPRTPAACCRHPVIRGAPPSLCGGQALLCAPSRRPSTDPQPCSERGPYCVDENTERRNHYLDLAGIENYTSRFGPGSQLCEKRSSAPRTHSGDKARGVGLCRELWSQAGHPQWPGPFPSGLVAV